jgi:hypothetical protein
MLPQLSACKEQFIIRAKLEVQEKFLSRMHQKKNEATEEETLANSCTRSPTGQYAVGVHKFCFKISTAQPIKA